MKFLKTNSAYLAFAIALMAMLGSLYFSEVLHFPPCVLCWYQRICLYPLVLITGVGILRRDAKFYLYALPLSIIGGLIGIYHNLLYYKILSEKVAPCINGVSCSAKYIHLLGFIDIPLLSLGGFIAITILLLIYRKAQNSNE